MDVPSLQKRLLKLAARERAALAKTLLSSLDERTDEEVERLWAEESVRRHEEVVRGKVRVKAADRVLRNARERLK